MRQFGQRTLAAIRAGLGPFSVMLHCTACTISSGGVLSHPKWLMPACSRCAATAARGGLRGGGRRRAHAQARLHREHYHRLLAARTAIAAASSSRCCCCCYCWHFGWALHSSRPAVWQHAQHAHTAALDSCQRPRHMYTRPRVHDKRHEAQTQGLQHRSLEL